MIEKGKLFFYFFFYLIRVVITIYNYFFINKLLKMKLIIKLKF